MSKDEFGLLFLKDKLKDIPFQVWEYDYLQDDMHLIHSSTREKNAPPSFYELTKTGSLHQVIKHEKHVSIILFFPEGNQVHVSIFDPSLLLSGKEITYLYHFFYVSQMKKTLQIKETELTNLVDSVRSITSSLDLEVVLGNIIQNALNVIPATDAGFLLLYDSVIDRLIPKAAIGFNDNIYNFNVRVGESITGKVFEDGKGRILNSKDEIFKEMDRHSISDANYHHITSAAYIPEAAICVAVSIEGVRIGAMIIHQWKRKKVMTDHDLRLLEGFAGQTAIAIQNAQYYSEAQNKITVITELSEELKVKNNQLQKRHEVHESLTNISLENKGLETIIFEFNQMIEQPVSFYNVLENKFYLNESNLTPDFTMHELKALFSSSTKPIHFERTDPHVQNFYLYPIFNGIVFLGCFMISVDDAISEADRITLEQGSSILALELIKKQTVTEYYYRKTHEQFQELLTLQDIDYLLKVGKEMGLNTSSYWVLTIFQITSFTDLQLLEIEILQLASEIKKVFPTSAKMIHGLNDQVILLFTISKPDQITSIKKDIQSIKKLWENSKRPFFRVGISATYKGLENIKKCYDEATKTLSYLASRDRIEIMSYEDIGLNQLFINQSNTEIERFISDVFSPFWSDYERNKELEETLLLYISTNRSATQTAKKLHIHINTLYQRIKKIEDLLELKLNDHEDSLKIQLACHLRTTYTQALQ